MSDDPIAASNAPGSPSESPDPGVDEQGPPINSERLAAIGRSLIVGEVAAGSLHDLNNSLQVVSGVTELLLRRDDLPEVVVEKLERIEHQTTRAATTSLTLQGLARERPGSRVVVDLEELAGRALALRSFRLSKAGIAARVEASPSQRHRVRVDPTRLQLALMALVLNAEQATPEGAEGAELVIRLERHDDRQVVVVRDDGGGVPEHLREQVFEPWFTTRPGAAGLGLWLVRETLAEHGGTVTIDQEAVSGTGTSVRLELPAEP